MVNFNIPSFDAGGKDTEEQPDLFKNVGVEVPNNPSAAELKKRTENEYYKLINKDIPITIHYFDLDDDTWSFTPMDYKQIKKTKSAKEALSNVINDNDSIENKQVESITKGILLNKLLEYLKIAFPKGYLSIIPDDSGYYSTKLSAKINSQRDKAYDYFLSNAFSQIFNINIENNPDGIIFQTLPLLDSKQIIEKLRLFLDQY